MHLTIYSILKCNKQTHAYTEWKFILISPTMSLFFFFWFFSFILFFLFFVLFFCTFQRVESVFSIAACHSFVCCGLRRLKTMIKYEMRYSCCALGSSVEKKKQHIFTSTSFCVLRNANVCFESSKHISMRNWKLLQMNFAGVGHKYTSKKWKKKTEKKQSFA